MYVFHMFQTSLIMKGKGRDFCVEGIPEKINV
jgi:hypothetical protein